MEQSQAKNKIIQTASILAVMLLFFAALWVLRKEIRNSNSSEEEVLNYFRQIPLKQYLVALCASLGSYFALTFYDVLGLRHIQKSMSYGRTALTSFIAYTFSHNVGAAVITGGGIRYRFYSAWGLTVGEAANVLVICGMTFWIGFLTMGSIFFFLETPDIPPTTEIPASAQIIFNSVFTAGLVCLVVLTAYLLVAVFFKKTIKIIRWKFPTPSVGIAVGQMAAGSLDWTCSGAALYLLLPHSSIPFPSFLAIYLMAQLAGFISQVPGGLGVLEGTMLLLLSPLMPAPHVAGALLAFRIVYYLIPFILGLTSFAVYEIVRNKAGFKRALQILNRWAPEFAPHVFAVLIFIGGGIVFFSNVSPEIPSRINRLSELMPISILEGSHFLTALAGAGLLVLARGLQQRLESAYVLALIFLGIGVLGCLFKGFDYQEALTLLVMWGLLLPSRRYFPRKSSLFQQTYPPLWVTAVLFVLLGSIWIGVFNYRYEDYSPALWTSFDISEDASRFLRATLGASFTLMLFSIISLFTPAQPETEAPNPAELAKAMGVAEKFRRAYAYFALLGDKALLFNKKADAFLMYAIEGKSWVTLGDPVGSQKEQQELAVKFKDMCRRNKAWPLFFEVDQDHFQFYLDMGLTVMKIGEEARVPLKSLTPEALASADLKNTYQRFKETEDYTFGVLPAGEWPLLSPELKKTSEDWLSKNKTREKGFSAGFYNERYLNYFPMAMVWKEGKVIAFANLQLSHGKEEVSVDLLRSSSEAPQHLEDYLILEVMFWSKERGFKWFNLGTAPLLDADESPLAPFKDQLKDILSPYETVPHLHEIRKAKERFNPEWSPKYLAASGNIPLAVAFNNIRSLVSKVPHLGIPK